MHISGELIYSYPYGSWSWGQKNLSIRREAQDRAQSREIFLKFSGKNLKALYFYLLANHAETAYFSFRDRELSNHIRLDQLRRGKVVVRTVFGLSQAGLLRQPYCRNNRKP